ncbi:unnamed protein product [Clonostachys rosea]|uniref:Uncharacterized protein n=1 Tax=Bionectria ochroleuca TaxID=29856 RepID=A0ABY6UEL6_BIOOC|nr:unnamed protein product [Clonostachys rosea]
MHFAKAIISLFAIAGFATAQEYEPALARRSLELAREEYLAAREEYLEQRDLYLRKQPNKKACSPFPQVPKGHCSVDTRSKRVVCVNGPFGGICGSCPANAKQGAECTCNS